MGSQFGMLSSLLRRLRIAHCWLLSSRMRNAHVQIYALLALFTPLSMPISYIRHELHHLLNPIFQMEVHG